MDLLSTSWTAIRSDGEIANSHVRRGRTVDQLLAATDFSDTGHRCIGSKIIRRQVTDDELKTVLAVPGIRVIVLQRGNIVRQYVSLRIARKDKIWRQPVSYPRSDVMVRAVEITSDQLLAYESRQKQVYESLRGFLSGMSFLSTTNEELTESRDLSIERVGEFLGVGKPDDFTSPRLRHQNLEPLSQLISNFNRLRSALSDLGRADLVALLDS